MSVMVKCRDALSAEYVRYTCPGGDGVLAGIATPVSHLGDARQMPDDARSGYVFQLRQAC